MIVPLYEQQQHPRAALNPCLTHKEDALWILNRFERRRSAPAATNLDARRWRQRAGRV